MIIPIPGLFKRSKFLYLILVLSICSLQIQAMEEEAQIKSDECHWDSLPNEIQLQILSLLPAKVEKIRDFFNYATVSNDFASLVSGCPFSKMEEYCSILKFLFRNSDKMQKKDKKMFPQPNDLIHFFTRAAQEGNYTIVDTLLRRGININERCWANENALCNAAKNKHTNIVKLLIDNGANIEEKDTLGTALDSAARNNDIDTINLLIKHGAKTVSPNSLYWAAYAGCITAAKFIIENSADAEKQDYCNSALLGAINGQKIKIVKYLIKNGANLEAQCDDRYTPLMLAAKNGNLEIGKLLIENGADTCAQRPDLPHEEIRLMFTQDDLDKDMSNMPYYNPLMIAALNGHLEMVKLLEENGGAALERRIHKMLVSAVRNKGFWIVASFLNTLRFR